MTNTSDKFKLKNILILAGGDSTRFWPLNNKYLFRFLGKPLIEHILENLARFAHNTIIVTNNSCIEETKKIVTKLKNKYSSTFKILIQKDQSHGQAGAILEAQNYINGQTLIVNSNDIFDFEIINKYIFQIHKKKLQFLLTAKKMDKHFPGGYLVLKNGKLSGIIETPDPDKTPSNLFRLVVDYFADFHTLVKIIKNLDSQMEDCYEKVLNVVIQSHGSDYFTYEDFWYSLKYPWHVLPMMQHYLNSLKNQKVKLGKNVKISRTAKIFGPAFVDDNTVVGDFAMIRESHIGKNCVIGGYSEVTRSYLSDKVLLHRNYVGDSILGKNVSMGAGAVTANYRFDGKAVSSVVNGNKVDTQLSKLGAIVGVNSRIGVNTTILPGIKIGKNTFVGPGGVIIEDLRDELFVFKHKVAKNTQLNKKL